MHSFLSRPRLAGVSTILAASTLSACGGGGGSAPEAAAQAAPASGVSTGLAAQVSPASLMDLSGWKLNLPIDTAGAATTQNAARTVLPQELVAGFSDDFFHADDQGHIVFTAPANGAVTTPGVGTDHTRSELREFDRQGDAKGDWTASGALSATCAIRQVASASPIAVIGQLRSENHVFAQVVYRVATQDVAVDVYQADTDGSRHAVTSLVSAIGLGQPVPYTLSFTAGVLTATANGTSRSFAVDTSWNVAPLYFKVGAYHTAPNTGNPAGDATSVACSAIAVTH